MAWQATRTTDASAEPVTPEEAKLQCRIEQDADEGLLDIYIKAARQIAEEYTGRQLITATWKLTLDGFDEFKDASDRIFLPRPPLGAVSTLAYTDGDGDSQSLTEDTDFVVNSVHEPAFIVPAYGKSWPSTRDITGAVEITYTAGYGAAGSSVPAPIRAAVLLLVGHMYANREAIVVGRMVMELPLGVDVLLSGWRVPWFW